MLSIFTYIIAIVIVILLFVRLRKIKRLISSDMMAINPDKKRANWYKVIAISHFIIMVYSLNQGLLESYFFIFTNGIILLMLLNGLVYYNEKGIVINYRLYTLAEDTSSLLDEQEKYKVYGLGNEKIIVYKKDDKLMKLLDLMSKEIG